MKKVPIIVTILAFMLLFGVAFAENMMMDGDGADWAAVPYAVENWVDGIEGLYPEEVGAIVTDNVDIKNVKAVVEGNVLYWFIQMHGGPAWPNDAKYREVDGVGVTRSRGYYHVLLDLDNNIETGWKTDWYESHYTTVGYLASVGQTGSDPLGAELWVEWGGRYFYPPPHSDSGGVKGGPHPSGVSDLAFWYSDWSEYDGVSDNELSFDMVGLYVPDPDSAKGMQFTGNLPNEDSGPDEILSNDHRFWYWSYGWGFDFLECATEVTPVVEYFERKTGQTFFKEGDVVGICGFNETPQDGWGVDITTRGEFVVGSRTMRPNLMTMDRDDSDWADVPFAVENWVDGIEGLYPEEVGAIVTDNVDIKDVKAVASLEQDAIYWYLRFHGGPAMPNDAKYTEVNGVPVTRSRGYYHVLLDLDNNIETGWKTDWYESHYTTVGYLASVGQPGSDPLGAEVWSELGIRYKYPAPHSDSGGIKNSGVQDLNLWMDDWSEYDGVSDNELSFGIAAYDIAVNDSATALQYDAMEPNLDSNDPTLLTGVPEYLGWSWGWDFCEVGHSISPMQKYFMNKTGQEFFKDGDVIGICGFSETPQDGWGVDISTRGQFIVGTGTAVGDRAALVDGYKLGDNYPNPFNPTTSIDYVLPAKANVNVTIFNALGQKVKTLVDRNMQAGNHIATWDGTNELGQPLATGMYYYSLQADDFSQTKKMMLVK